MDVRRRRINLVPWYIRGAMLNSALYLGSVFVAGLVTHDKLVWQLAILAMGVTYVAYSVAIHDDRSPASTTLTLLSIGLGALAGILLL